jgi:hypothetical protein
MASINKKRTRDKTLTGSQVQRQVDNPRLAIIPEADLNNRRIIELAIMQLAVDRAPGDEPLGDRFSAALERALDADPTMAIQMTLAVKLLSGKRYQIISDNPETIRRARAIAADIGASVEALEELDGMTRVIFKPANLL